MASDKVRFIDKIRRFDRLLAKAQMGNGYAAGFFRIISKVGLSIQVCMIANDFNGALIGADGAVRTKTPELTSFRTDWRRINILAKRQ